MSSNIEKYKLEEKVRRSFFKHRGNISAVIKETGLEPNYVRNLVRKIRKGFRKDINFETACFITDCILSGREQRLILLEDRLQELLAKKEVVSICCGMPISIHKYEGKEWYKCKRCGENCEVTEIDKVRDLDVVRLVECMQKEDELIGKFLALMGLVSTKKAEQEEYPQTKKVESTPVNFQERPLLPPPEKRLMEKLGKLPQSKVNEIRRKIETLIDEALQENG